MEPIAKHRFLALDGWRGVCALFIVFFHFNAFTHINQLAFIGGAYLFVDFFFVLSGFVIAASYLEKLSAGYSVRDYILLRLGRIYPLHAFVLLLFVVFSFVKFYAEGQVPFSKEDQSLHALVSSFLLIQGLGIYDYEVWNIPAWSISTEFFTYIIFALMVVIFRRHINTVALLLIGVLTALFWGSNLFTLELYYALPRCLFGFLCGVICYSIFKNKSQTVSFAPVRASVMEGALIAIVIIFLTYFGQSSLTFLAPFIFSGCVLVFSLERGMFSRLLKTAPFQFLGMISYTIYMTHTFVQSCFYSGMRILEKLTGWDLHSPPVQEDYLPRIGDNLWMGDAVAVLMVGAVLLTGGLVYRFLEKPANDWVRARVRKQGGWTNKLR